MRYFFILLWSLLHISCSSIKKPALVQTEKYIVYSEITASSTPIHTTGGGTPNTINTGEWITFVDDTSNFIIAYPADYPEGHPSFMSDMQIDRSVPSCSASITGVSESESLSRANDKTIWGKVDAFDAPNPDFPPDTQPRCRPPVLKWDYDISRGGVIRLSNDAAYALCSEKDDKTVLVCLSQVTDNPALAEKIFSTFRWTR